MTPEQEKIIQRATNRYVQAKATADLMEQHVRELYQVAELGKAQDEPADEESPEAVESEQDEAI